MNVLFFLTPKENVAYIYSDVTVRQALEKMKYYHYTAIIFLITQLSWYLVLSYLLIL